MIRFCWFALLFALLPAGAPFAASPTPSPLATEVELPASVSPFQPIPIGTPREHLERELDPILKGRWREGVDGPYYVYNLRWFDEFFRVYQHFVDTEAGYSVMKLRRRSISAEGSDGQNIKRRRSGVDPQAVEELCYGGLHQQMLNALKASWGEPTQVGEEEIEDISERLLPLSALCGSDYRCTKAGERRQREWRFQLENGTRARLLLDYEGEDHYLIYADSARPGSLNERRTQCEVAIVFDNDQHPAPANPGLLNPLLAR